MYLQFDSKSSFAGKINIKTDRFSIGSGSNNDLILNETGIDKTHALISKTFNLFFLSDQNSSTGTHINGKRIKSVVQLKDGDIIHFGKNVKATVLFTNNISPIRHGRLFSSFNAEKIPPFALKFISANKLTISLFCLLLIFIGIAALLLLNSDSNSQANGAENSNVIGKHSNNIENQTNKNREIESPSRNEQYNEKPTFTENENDATIRENLNYSRNDSHPVLLDSPNANAASGPSDDESARNSTVRQDVLNVITTIAQDTSKKSSVINDTIISQIEQEIDKQIKSSKLEGIFKEFQRDERRFDLIQKIRSENLPVNLVIFAALVDIEGRENLVNKAKKELNEIKFLAATFNVANSDSSLIIIAAQTEGTGSGKSHPLHGRMRKLISDINTQRNVGYLYKNNGISEVAYNRVIKFLALGAISVNPKKYGIDCDPLSY